MKDLRERFAKVEIQPSKPIVPFRETAAKASEMAPSKTSNATRGTIHGSSGHSVVKFIIRAAPLPSEILSFLQDNLLVLRKLQQEKKIREQSQSSEATEGESEHDQGGSSDQSQEDDDDKFDMEEGVSMYGDVYRKPTVRPEDFWSGLDSVCKKAGSDWKDVADKVWAFGPQSAGGCILIDAREGVLPNS